jgi:putative endonuclease
MSTPAELGSWGESEAENYLRDIGYKILERNYRSGNQEADIIAMDGDTLVIVEVKTRTSERWGMPEEFVNEQKERYLVRLAEKYMDDNDMVNEMRLDIISVVPGKSKNTLRHIINIL